MEKKVNGQDETTPCLNFSLCATPQQPSGKDKNLQGV